ncbi:NlpC/P60 family protein [Peterkaempfera griseoplana]|uniref:C40 family peptidase n=1 Tax=Peterkaempfera griseoplana TaxID=66896 RepID=UPI0006E2B5E8|nr:C40 family peptidase [Peterkaempfera griseoplana]
MADDQFGVQLQELSKLQQEWHSASEQLAEVSKQLGSIQATIARAAGIDLAAAALGGGVGGLATAYEVLKDVKAIESQAAALAGVQQKLTAELAVDAQKLKAVADEYAAADRRIHEQMKKHEKEQTKPKSPKHTGGGDGKGGGGTSTGSDSYQGHGDGKWKTVGSWDAWKPGTHHTTTGAGVQTAPDTSGLSEVRRGILDRALERINHRIGYSQSATTNGYRDDCSGFVSAAWGLKPPGLNTDGLQGRSVSHPITKDELQPGDALIAGDHTVLFGGWADAAHTKYIALEDNGSQGTVSHVIPYPYYSGDAAHERAIGQPYVPYRRNDL